MEMARSGNKKRIVLKVGSSTLTQGSNRISRGKIEDLADQILMLRDSSEIVLVSSGAIAAARQFVKLDFGGDLEDKQALAAIGQVHLMRIYQEVFRDRGLSIAQCLLTHYDFNNDVSRMNIKRTFHSLLDHGYVPIINENDTVATEEIQFGDNDKLAALTAVLFKADLLVLATDTHGVYDQDPNIFPDARLMSKLDQPEVILEELEELPSSLGRGGMRSKIESAMVARKAGIETWILHGGPDQFLVKALQSQSEFTRIV